MKKLFKLFLILVIVVLCGNSVLEMNGITIRNDVNPDEVTVLSINDNYCIEIDEEFGVGYVIKNDTIILGTCEVSLIMGDMSIVSLCRSTDNSMGRLIIDTNNLNIVLSEGNISNIFSINTKVIINW